MAENPLVKTGATALATTDALARAADYASASKADSTKRAYRSDWQDFELWCAQHGAAPLPAGIGTVAAYLASLADSGRKASTITRRAAALGYAHRLAGMPPPTAAEPIKAVLRGIRRRIGVATERKAPATARAIAKMLKGASVRDRAILLLGFAAALRRSEITALQVGDLEFTSDGLIVHIRKSKTDQEGEGHQVAVPQGSKLRPVEAVRDWLAGRTEGPLFGVSDATVARIVKRAARRAGFDPAEMSGHSLRAGFVTSALERGADLLKVMDVTRHRAIGTLKVYDRRAQAFKNHAGKDFL